MLIHHTVIHMGMADLAAVLPAWPLTTTGAAAASGMPKPDAPHQGQAQPGGSVNGASGVPNGANGQAKDHRRGTCDAGAFAAAAGALGDRERKSLLGYCRSAMSSAESSRSNVGATIAAWSSGHLVTVSASLNAAYAESRNVQKLLCEMIEILAGSRDPAESMTKAAA